MLCDVVLQWGCVVLRYDVVCDVVLRYAVMLCCVVLYCIMVWCDMLCRGVCMLCSVA